MARLPRWLTRIYIEEMPLIQAGETARAMEIADHPYMDEKSRRTIHRRLRSILGHFADTAPAVNAKTHAGKHTLAGLGIGVTKGDDA